MANTDDHDSALPPLPADHGFIEGERVKFRVWGHGLIEGTVQDIDVTFGTKRYRGLAILGDDQRYYELDPEVTEKISNG